MTTRMPTMAAPLQAILEAELEAGNEVEEVSSWLPKCSLLVILRRPFREAHPQSFDVQFVEVNDPHYWKAEYRYRGGSQVLACRFQ